MNKSDFKIFNFFILCIVLLGLTSALQKIHITFGPPPPAPRPKAPPSLPYIPQFVLISFDGSRSVDTWKDLRLFKEKMNAEQRLLNFTYFINAAYFLTEDTKNAYKGPGHERGTSNIGFSEDLDQLRMRIEEVNKAVVDGDEIAPHTVGHFSGALWTKDEWKEELDSFDQILFGLDTIYPDAHLPKLNLSRSDIVGFRAPYLDKSLGLYDALHEKQFFYDTSEVGSGEEWPVKDQQGVWRIPLGTIALGKNKSSVLAMDYNIYVHDTQAIDLFKKGTPEWKAAYENSLAAFLEYFERNYTGNRAPVLVGYHFSQSWNDGVYWEVMKDFARQVCGKPEVRCGTFRDLVNYMEKHGVPKK